MRRKQWLAMTSWIIIVTCLACTGAGKPSDTPSRDFSKLRNVLDASTIDSCDEVPKPSLTHNRQRRSVEDDEDLGEPRCLEETDPIYYVSKYHRGVCHVSVELAYEVFFGRSPSQDEFKEWYDKCVMREIDEAYMMWKFTESDEHMDFLERKRKEKEEKEGEGTQSESSAGMEVEAEVEMEIPVTVPLKLRVEDREYLDALNDTESDEFKELADSYADALVELLRDMPGLLGVKILGFRKGSLIVFYELVFDEQEAPKLYDEKAESETFDQQSFAKKVKEKVRGVMQEAVETNQLQQKLGDLHFDLESLDTVSEEVINDLVKKNPKAPTVPLDVKSHNSTNKIEGRAGNGENTENTKLDTTPSPTDPENNNMINGITNSELETDDMLDTATNNEAIEYSGSNHEEMDGKASNFKDAEVNSIEYIPTIEEIENSEYENGGDYQNIPKNTEKTPAAEMYEDVSEATDLKDLATESYEGHEENSKSVNSPVEETHEGNDEIEDGVAPTAAYAAYEAPNDSNSDEYNTATPIPSQVSHNHTQSEENALQIQVLTTVPTYFQDITTEPPSYAEIPEVGTLGLFDRTSEYITTPDGTTPPPTEASFVTRNYPTLSTEYQGTTASKGINADHSIMYSTTRPTALYTTQSVHSTMTSTSLKLVTTPSPTTEKYSDTTTTVKTPSPHAAIPESTTTQPLITEDRMTTGFSEWDAEYLDSLDNDYFHDYSYENDATHHDVTVLDTTSSDYATAPPSVTTQETAGEITHTINNADDVTTPHYDATKVHNTTQLKNDSMTQISPTPERAKSADITRSGANETTPSQTVMMKLRVTNMNYTHNLTDRQSEEFQLLEAKFRQLLHPLLQSLDGFVDMEVLGFSYGSLIVNNEIKFEKAVPDNVKEEVRERIRAATAYFKYAHLAVDTDFTEVLKSDEADLCEFVQCHLYANCVVKRDYRTECICLPGYVSIDPTQCVSVCNLDPEYCQNGGECETVPGRGPVCRCKVSFNWGFKGERCEEPLPRSVLLVSASTGIACLAFLLLLGGFCYSLHKRKRIVKAQKKQKLADKVFMRAAQIMSSPARRPAKGELQRVNPVFVTEDETLSSSDNNAQGPRRSPSRPASVVSSDKSVGSMSTQSFYLREHIGNNGPLPSDLNTPERRLLRLQIQQYPDHVRTWGRQDAMNAMRCPRQTTGEEHARATTHRHHNAL